MNHTTECLFCGGGTSQAYPCICSTPKIAALKKKATCSKTELATQHTPEPWGYKYDNSDYSGGGEWYDITDSKGINVLWCAYNSGNEKLIEANASRIVACVNACAGIPTDVLEIGSKLINDFEKAKHQRDELLTELELAKTDAHNKSLRIQELHSRNAELLATLRSMVDTYKFMPDEDAIVIMVDTAEKAIAKAGAAYKTQQACESANSVEKDLFKIKSHDISVRIIELQETQGELIKMIQLLIRDWIIDADLEQQAESLVAKFAGKSEN